MTPLFECEIPGRPIVKKNTQRIVGSGRSRRAIYSPRYTQWELNAIAACKRAFDGQAINCPVHAEFEFFFKSRQSEADTSNLIEGPADMLKKAGVIVDDKIFIRITATKWFSSMELTVIRLWEFNPDLDLKGVA